MVIIDAAVIGQKDKISTFSLKNVAEKIVNKIGAEKK
jgi:hypothetical protein